MQDDNEHSSLATTTRHRDTALCSSVREGVKKIDRAKTDVHTYGALNSSNESDVD